VLTVQLYSEYRTIVDRLGSGDQLVPVFIFFIKECCHTLTSVSTSTFYMLEHLHIGIIPWAVGQRVDVAMMQCTCT